MFSRAAGIVGLAGVLSACGGQSTSDGSAGSGGAATGGSGGTAVGGSGGTSVGGTAGTSVGGSGGTSVGGSGGVECDATIQQKASLGGPPVGFEALPGAPGPVLVTEVLPNELKLNPGPGGGTFSFKWAGPDLTKKFAQGQMVSVGSQDGWDYVSGDANTAVARRDDGFVAPTEIPDMPNYGPHMGYANQCSFVEATGGCGQPPAAVTVLALEATTGAGVVTIPASATETFMSWEITNVNNIQFPGYGSENCDVEAAFVGIITAVSPSMDMAQ